MSSKNANRDYKKKKYYKKSAKVPKNVYKFVKKELDKSVEDKYRLITLSSSGIGSIGSTWGEIGLEQIPQGTNNGERIGNKIRIKSIEIKGVFQGAQTVSHTAADDEYNIWRFVVGLYGGYQNVTPMTSSAIGLNTPIDKLTTRGLEKLYKDAYFTIASPNPLTVGWQVATMPFMYKRWFKKPIEITYGGTTSNTTTNHSLVISCLSDSAVVPHVGFTRGYIKVYYEDA